MMRQYIAALCAFFATSVVAQDGATGLGKGGADFATAIGIDFNFFDTYQYKQLTPFYDFSGNCTEPGDGLWDYDFKPDVPHAINVKFRTCWKRPIFVDAWKFTLTDKCADGLIMRPTVRTVWQAPGFGANTRVIDGVLHDVVDRVEVETCFRPSIDYTAECTGEWINKPVWDYEWIIKVPNDWQYNKDKCGATFEPALREACEPYETSKFECELHPPGAWMRFRTKLLCGRTRIQNAIKNATNGEMDVRCPYFAEVPVPR